MSAIPSSKRGLSGSALVSGSVVSRVFRQKRGVLAEIGHSQIKIEPLCNEAAPRPLTICGGETCPQPTRRPATSPLHRSARRGRLARDDRRFKIGHCERNDSKTGRLDSSAPAMSGAEIPTRCIILPPSGVLNYDGLSFPRWGRFFSRPAASNRRADRS